MQRFQQLETGTCVSHTFLATPGFAEHCICYRPPPPPSIPHSVCSRLKTSVIFQLGSFKNPEQAGACGAATVDHADNENRTPLWTSCQNGHLAVARLLLGAGAAVNAAQRNGCTPLYVAAEFGHAEVAQPGRDMTEHGARSTDHTHHFNQSLSPTFQF